MNDTVKCDGGLYKSLQAWKDHKLHIEHEVLPHSTLLVTLCKSHFRQSFIRLGLFLCASLFRLKPCRLRSRTFGKSKVT